jgi:hypothetical protein
MTSYLFKQWLVFFCSFVLGGVSPKNKHFLILNGHASHVIIQVEKQAPKLG